MMKRSAAMPFQGKPYPMYEQIAAVLKREIADGSYSATGRLPSEVKLMERFAVSRVTVRQALDLLVQDGLVERHRGRGSFLARPRLRYKMNTLRGFYDELVLAGVDPETEMLEFGPRMLPRAWVKDLDWPGDRAIFLQRLYRVDDKPLAVINAYLHPMTQTVERQQASTHTIYSIFAEILHQPIEYADISISLVPANHRCATLLELKPGTPLLSMYRTSGLSNNRIAERTQFLIRPDEYEFVWQVSGMTASTMRLARIRQR
ncbi:GntR family transcriptional regulator [Brenneria goodwinii]|uniref:GntR family transcriptional regulator n=1 Tax=Brenneria goodwinii TaxID=1109412 RepID=UPI0036E6E994